MRNRQVARNWLVQPTAQLTWRGAPGGTGLRNQRRQGTPRPQSRLVDLPDRRLAVTGEVEEPLAESVADGYVLLPAAHDASAPGTFQPRSLSLRAAPPPIGLTAADSFAGGEVSRAASCTLTRHFDLCSLS